MAILIMSNLQLGPEHSLGLAWELAAFEFGVSEGATSVIFTGPPPCWRRAHGRSRRRSQARTRPLR